MPTLPMLTCHCATTPNCSSANVPTPQSCQHAPMHPTCPHQIHPPATNTHGAVTRQHSVTARMTRRNECHRIETSLWPPATSHPLTRYRSTCSHPPRARSIIKSQFYVRTRNFTVHPTVPSQEVLMAQTMISSPHAHLLYFVHEVLWQYRTSSKLRSVTLAAKDLVRKILADRAHLTRLTCQYNCSPTGLPRLVCRYSPQSTKDFLTPLVLSTKFRQDRAYSNSHGQNFPTF
jgi:hypothetical protein